MGVMEMRHRILMQKPPTIPWKYQQVEYLFRSSSAYGPYCTLEFPVSIGDVLTVKVKPVNLSGERAFGCTYLYNLDGVNHSIELYYQNSTGALRAWATTNDSITFMATTGSVDTLEVIFGNASIVEKIGTYRNAYLYNGNIYGLEIKDSGGNMKHKLIPCYRKSDNEPGFYDTITDTFYPNDAGSGTFVCGGNVND